MREEIGAIMPVGGKRSDSSRGSSSKILEQPRALVGKKGLSSDDRKDSRRRKIEMKRKLIFDVQKERDTSTRDWGFIYSIGKKSREEKKDERRAKLTQKSKLLWEGEEKGENYALEEHEESLDQRDVASIKEGEDRAKGSADTFRQRGLILVSREWKNEAYRRGVRIGQQNRTLPPGKSRLEKGEVIINDLTGRQPHGGGKGGEHEDACKLNGRSLKFCGESRGKRFCGST